MHLTTVYSEEGAMCKVVAMVFRNFKIYKNPESGYPTANYSGRPHHLNAKKFWYLQLPKKLQVQIKEDRT